MVCDRCMSAVKSTLEETGLEYTSVKLGEAELAKAPTDAQLASLKERLVQSGFELLDDARQQLIEKIKNIIIGLVHYQEFDERYNLSDTLSSQLHKDYSYLSHLFSSVEGTTIEKYLINQRIERVKELLVYDELSLSETAFRMGYSSVAHLSAQFKKVTGLTPTHFKKLGGLHRKNLDKV